MFMVRSHGNTFEEDKIDVAFSSGEKNFFNVFSEMIKSTIKAFEENPENVDWSHLSLDCVGREMYVEIEKVNDGELKVSIEGEFKFFKG